MLQVARLAPRLLGESRDLVAGFVRAHRNPDGGFQDRAGASDLYYTVFGLDALIALQEDLPADETVAFLAARAVRDLDYVHIACLARGWAALRQLPGPDVVDDLLARIESCRAADGGYATSPGADHGSAYASFVALGAYQDCGRELPEPERVLDSIHRLRAAGGGYANHPDLPLGLTPSTAAAVMVMRHLGAPPDHDAGMWLLDRCHSRGGFFAAPAAPVPDLLSTATALHALSSLQVPIGGIAEPCLDFIDSLWTNRGGFYGTWADDAADCEYTYYALLALGHLSLEPASS
jgi:geranylgeranyl transferase type-2 subunit beta